MAPRAEFKRGDHVQVADHYHAGEFRVMAIADGYAMVRRPRCYPFVAPLKDLRPASPEDTTDDN